MFGLERSVDLSFLQGAEVTSVTVGLHQVNLHIEPDVRVELLSNIRVGSQGALADYDLPARAAGRLVELVGASIESVENIGDGSITLQFDNGIALFLFDDEPNFEAYVIQHGDHTIVV